MTNGWGRKLCDLERWMDGHNKMITAAEADQLSISAHARRRLVEDGWLARSHRPLYVRARDVGDRALELRCAVTAAGTGSAASHRSAGWWLGMLDYAPATPQVTVSPDRRVRLRDVAVHRAVLLGECRHQHGLLVTSPERTILDLAAAPEIRSRTIELSIERALSLRLTTEARLIDAATARPGRRRYGRPRLADILRAQGLLGCPGVSALEHRAGRLFAELHRDYDVELPATEHVIDGGRYRLDFAWPHLRLAIEVAGYAWHSGPGDLEHDLIRRNGLIAAGWIVLTFAWRQVVDEPATFCAEVLAAYERAARR